jgi:long-chain acyl-CoA synthetase
MLTNKTLYTAFGSAPNWQLDADAVNMAAMPLFHIGGAGWAMVGMHLGATTVTMRDAEPGAMLEAISRFHITNAFVVPALLQAALDHPALPTSDLS